MSPITFMFGVVTDSVVVTAVAMIVDYFRGRKYKGSPTTVTVDDSVAVTVTETQSGLDIEQGQEPQGDGPLFGLHPPEGTVFQVIFDAPYWKVSIVDAEDGRRLCGHSFIASDTVTSPKDEIVACAIRVVRAYTANQLPEAPAGMLFKTGHSFYTGKFVELSGNGFDVQMSAGYGDKDTLGELAIKALNQYEAWRKFGHLAGTYPPKETRIVEVEK